MFAHMARTRAGDQLRLKSTSCQILMIFIDLLAVFILINADNRYHRASSVIQKHKVMKGKGKVTKIPDLNFEAENHCLDVIRASHVTHCVT